MQFANPIFLKILIFLPLLLLFFIFSFRLKKRRIRNFISVDLIPKIFRFHSSAKQLSQILLLLLTFTFIALCLARPQWGDETIEVKQIGMDIIFLLDTSRSMLSEDQLPSRFKKGILEIESFLDQMKNNRAGLVTFSGDSFVHCPLTLDYGSVRLFLDTLSIEDNNYYSGTNLNNSVSKVINAFGLEKKGIRNKALIILSDGEDHENDPRSIALKFNKANIRVYTIGLGTIEGGLIPIKDTFGNHLKDHRDKDGNIVITKKNKLYLESLAKHAGGKYFDATAAESEINFILNDIENLEKTELGQSSINQKKDHYELFLWIILALLILESLLTETKMIQPKQFYDSLIMVLIFILYSGFFNETNTQITLANKKYESKDYQSALEIYSEIRKNRPEDTLVHYNIGNTYYRKKEFSLSIASYLLVLKAYQDDEINIIKENTLFNLANSYYQNKELEKAIETLKNLLLLSPNNKDALINLEFMLLESEENNQKPESNPKSQNEDKTDPNQQDQGGNNKSPNQESESDSDNKKKDSQGDNQNQNEAGDSDDQQNTPENNESQGDESPEDSNSGEDTNASGESPDKNPDENADAETEEKKDKTPHPSGVKPEQGNQNNAQDMQAQAPNPQSQMNNPNEMQTDSSHQDNELKSGTMTKEEAERLLQALSDFNQNGPVIPGLDLEKDDKNSSGKDW